MPTIFGQKAADPLATQPPKFSNLSELANAHLNSAQLPNEPPKTLSQSIRIPQLTNRSNFVIPKLSGSSGSVSPSSTTGETPHEMSLKKIMDLKRLHISSNHSSSDTENTPPDRQATDSNETDAQKQFPIDLVSALNAPNFSKSIITPAKPIVEQIHFKFTDCDITGKGGRHTSVTPTFATNTSISHDCTLTISNILQQHFDSRTMSTTDFGRVLCSKYKRKRQPVILHGFVNKHHIKPFEFNVLPKYK